MLDSRNVCVFKTWEKTYSSAQERTIFEMSEKKIQAGT